MNLKTYQIYHSPSIPPLDNLWDADAWAKAETAAVDYFYKEGSVHQPKTEAKLLWCPEGFAGIYRVEDRYVRSIHTSFQDPVYQDACIEFFVKPAGSTGYFNFEFNAGGALLCSYVTDPTRVGTGLKASKRLSLDDCKRVQIHSSLPDRIEPELPDPVTWTLQFFIPFSLMETYTKFTWPNVGDSWRCNFYKCAENNSHPHWASWQALEGLNFHQPDGFGKLEFVEDAL
ncbi:carbohydrate-binding family 9-like protein [Treponema sp.]